jgi:hypothetical protein
MWPLSLLDHEKKFLMATFDILFELFVAWHLMSRTQQASGFLAEILRTSRSATS